MIRSSALVEERRALSFGAADGETATTLCSDCPRWVVDGAPGEGGIETG